MSVSPARKPSRRHSSFRWASYSENPSVNLKDLLRTPAAITVDLPGGECRYIHGVFNRLKQHEMGKDKLVAYEGTLVPHLWFLSLTSDCRIFQNKTVPQIVEQILKDNSVSDFKLQLSGSYPARDYCV